MPKQMFRFEKLIINRRRMSFHNLKYFPQVLRLYLKHIKYLEDDFSDIRENVLEGLIRYVESVSPHFYLVLSNDELCGFFVLENVVGRLDNLYSAYVVTCFDMKYWGIFTKNAGRLFRDFCFEELGFVKIKALVYPQNFRVRAILRACEFRKEACLEFETLRGGKPQSLEVYSVLNLKKLKEIKCK